MSVTATIKWFDRKKGYGFATPEGGGDDVFVHALNIAKDADNKQPFIDDGDTIYYDVGEHNGRPTAINVTFPPDRPQRPRRRTRGRNAKKAADDEAEAIGEEHEAAADAAVKGEGGGDPVKERQGGGRDNKTHRATNTRPRRNDKGLGAKPKGGSKPQGRNDKSEDTAQAASDGKADATTA
jgi:cold shock CspA family protein